MKTNKIKPIKKLMIFTIITVMVVSLFAVPTFALVNNVDWPDDSQGTIDAITLNVDGYSISTAGMYFLRVVGYSFDGDMLGSTDHYELFPENDETLGYVRVVDLMGANHDYEIITPAGGTRVYSDNSGNVYYEFPAFDGDSFKNTYTSYRARDIMGMEFYFNTYPPTPWGGNIIDTVWNSALLAGAEFYTVASASTPELDPEEPTDPTPPADGEEQGIFAVWSKITQWIVQGLASVSNAFYADGKLTLLGTLCIIPLALGLAFLLIGIIQKFLRLRG